MKQLQVDKPDFVFTTATRPRSDVERSGIDGDFVPAGYLDVFRQWREQGQKVIAVRDTPWALDGKVRPPECVASGRLPEACGEREARTISPTNPTKKIAPEFPNMTFLDYHEAMCKPVPDSVENICPAVVGNILVWHDTHHITTAFMRSLVPYIDADLQKATGWW